MRLQYLNTFTGTEMLSVLPYIYRYEDQNYIEEFFQTGKIMLSTFQNYRKYEDNELGDSGEGISSHMIQSKVNDVHLSTFNVAGGTSFCFCTSTVLHQDLLSTFSRNSAFRIKDPLQFVAELTRSLNNIKQVYYGNCLYVNSKMFSEINDNLTHELIEKEGAFSIANTLTSVESFFLKDMKYQHQSEFRMIWDTDNLTTESIIVDCPRAIKYCEMVDF